MNLRSAGCRWRLVPCFARAGQRSCRKKKLTWLIILVHPVYWRCISDFMQPLYQYFHTYKKMRVSPKRFGNLLFGYSDYCLIGTFLTWNYPNQNWVFCIVSRVSEMITDQFEMGLNFSIQCSSNQSADSLIDAFWEVIIIYNPKLSNIKP